jgi:hypothetical protein
MFRDTMLRHIFQSLLLLLLPLPLLILSTILLPALTLPVVPLPVLPVPVSLTLKAVLRAPLLPLTPLPTATPLLPLVLGHINHIRGLLLLAGGEDGIVLAGRGRPFGRGPRGQGVRLVVVLYYPALYLEAVLGLAGGRLCGGELLGFALAQEVVVGWDVDHLLGVLAAL